VLPTERYTIDQIKNNAMGWECGTSGGEVKLIEFIDRILIGYRF
jgi:hypothetical protein